jgi:hypothetical protein
MVVNNIFNEIELKGTSLYECYDNNHWEKRIFLWGWENNYASIIHSSSVNYTIETNKENWKYWFFFLCPINEEKDSSLKLKFYVNHSWIKLDVHIIAFLYTDAKVTLDADIVMKEWIQWSSASLLEESIILSQKINVKSLPVLDIHAKNIQASHWAKIYRLDDDKLFYLRSKWLNKNQSENLILSSFWERMFDSVNMEEKEREELLEKYFKS